MSLKESFSPYFRVGAAIASPDITTPSHTKLMTEQFNSMTCENDMKPMYSLDQAENLAHPEKYNLSPATKFDRMKPFLDFATEHKLPMRGHTLVWHNQTPKYFFHENYDVEAPLASREVMLARLESYIRSVLTFVQTNYPGLIYAWDVVNEIVDEGDFRKSLWSQTVGTDFFLYAFRFARKYVAEGVQLFYNDYSTALVWKRDFILEKVLKPLMAEGLVDGMGMQSHLTMEEPELDMYKIALEMYGALGLVIHITELDIHNNDPSEASQTALAERYAKLFTILRDAKAEGKANIECVTFWNLLDEESWLSGFRKERSYPLLFHNDDQPKAAYYAVLDILK